MRTAALVLVAAAAAVTVGGCASSAPPEPRTRGWLGGTFVPVRGTSFLHPVPTLDGPVVVGAPDGVTGGALVTAAAPDAPLAVAGLRAGDLVLTVGGEPVADGDDVRDAAERVAPGASVRVEWWRGGAGRMSADVAAGRETWERRGTIRIGVGLSSSLDLWPFDDGIDVLGLVRVRTLRGEADLTGPEAAYLRAARPGEPLPPCLVRGFDVHLAILGGGSEERATDQTAVW